MKEGDMKELTRILPKERIKDRLIDRISFAPDAGFYYLLPKVVVQPMSEREIISLFRLSHELGIPVVFRAGGTSLSGQSITDGILVDLSNYWRKVSVEEAGASVRVQPGITGAMVNAQLKKHGRKIGPDPSSISAAMMGGILSNNASGMCCGTVDNSYHTTRHIRFILPDGEVFSTESEADYARFESCRADLYGGLRAIRDEILGDRVLYDRIRKKYRTKTTVGYSLNALVDYEHPMDIFARLLIGGEGTLAFIAEAVLETVPDPPYKSAAMLYFPGISEACLAIGPLTSLGAAMVELMDRASLRSVENLEGISPVVGTLGEGAAALLVEFQAESPDALADKVNGFFEICDGLSLSFMPSFTVGKERDLLWKMRKGLFPSVGSVRARGTTVILEDIGFPVEYLGAAILHLQSLFRLHGYAEAIIFGHAKDGNIHFVITQAFEGMGEIGRYDAFMRDVVDLVVHRYGGTLKAEHGTGRNMAPFVETEWGADAYRIMKQIKTLADPRGLLNPGVLINEGRNAHLEHLKALPPVEVEVDKCIECGYCEPKCPSRDITMSPRRRIVVRRALQTMKQEGDAAGFRVLSREYQYDGLDTCAVDGLCAVSCPVDINTGDLVKRLRRESHSPVANRAALLAARHFGGAEWMVRLLLQGGMLVNRIAGRGTMSGLTSLLRRIFRKMPLWTPEITAPPDMRWARGGVGVDAEKRAGDEIGEVGRRGDAGGEVGEEGKQGDAGQKKIVYFPSCISRMMGTYNGKSKNIMECFLSICGKTGITVIVHKRFRNLCCSQLFASKGFEDAYRYKANEIIRELWDASDAARWPIVMDVSSCTYTLKHLRGMLTGDNLWKYDRLQFLDSVEFLHDMVMPASVVIDRKNRVVLHPVCSLEKMHTGAKLERLASHYAKDVVIPLQHGCCGMAGDRGFIFPELTASATREEAAEVQVGTYDGCYSTTKTCEMAMSAATGVHYESILYLIDETI